MATTMKYSAVSLTRLAECFDKEGFTYSMLLQFFIAIGWLKDAKTVTPKGIENGIRMSSNGGFLTYNKNAWETVRANTYEIEKHFQLPFTVVDPKEKRRKLNEAIIKNRTLPFNPMERKTVYPYLGIENFVIMDTETTGNSHQDEVVEIGIIDMNGNVIYESYFMPEKRFSQSAAAVNKLNKAFLKSVKAPYFKDEWPKIVNLIKGYTILGHNLSYDKRMIIDTCKKYELDDVEAADLFTNYEDSKRIAQNWMIASNYKLDDLSTMLGITWDETHDATDDCKMTLQFLQSLENAIRCKINGDTSYPFIKDPRYSLKSFEL